MMPHMKKKLAALHRGWDRFFKDDKSIIGGIAKIDDLLIILIFRKNMVLDFHVWPRN